MVKELWQYRFPGGEKPARLAPCATVCHLALFAERLVARIRHDVITTEPRLHHGPASVCCHGNAQCAAVTCATPTRRRTLDNTNVVGMCSKKRSPRYFTDFRTRWPILGRIEYMTYALLRSTIPASVSLSCHAHLCAEKAERIEVLFRMETPVA